MDILPQLHDLVIRLYEETVDYLDNQSDAQLWYNRGYANGVVSILMEVGLEGELISRLTLDDMALHAEDRFMAWTKAYHHGFEMGAHEAREVLVDV